ncbi:MULTISPECIES: hypothetical protein [Syntrophotalea]|uniref:Uncharacterized protein n=1 Tax=Syntrophotalea acetylenica TaxID=29542 RepID=A0A1L3GF86_SYNAC|nr:hypothetical protein [Syntrophotalea acetylenica]APG24485.1 hypothetical protein A7E75_05135 [Syntrophotalea acetylenica]APG45070.1 hypothetical protein A6070_13785 [Syntrophotalea acetylenica]MDY0262330.1 hypothetical protein [Syntrophotalea acetylenica]
MRNSSSRQNPPNPLCARCLRDCRQSQGTLVISCPRFLPRPFKVKDYRFDQLDLFSPPRKK